MATARSKRPRAPEVEAERSTFRKSGINADPRVKQFQRDMADALKSGPKRGKSVFS